MYPILNRRLALVVITLLLANGSLWPDTQVNEVRPGISHWMGTKFDGNNGGEETPCERFNRQAVEAMSKRDWKSASSNLMSAMKEDSQDPATYINFGVFHFMREEYPSSEKALLKALEIDPENAEALFNYSRVMVLKGEKESALQSAIEAAEKADPQEWKYYSWLGNMRGNRAEFTQAVESFSTAIILLEENLETINQAINREESKQEIVERSGIITTDHKVAPAEWYSMKEYLEKSLADLQKRKEDAFKEESS